MSALRITKFAGEFAALAAWTGEPEEQLRAEEDYHSEERDHWLAWEGDDVVGVLHPWRRPDSRLALYYGKCRGDAYAPLAAAVEGDCYTTIDAADDAMLAALREVGFTELRREDLYEIPVAQVSAPVPEGIRIITADQTELDPLMTLDCQIRADIPGADGWQPDPVWFREETYDSPFFDPQTYRVALDGDDYVGLARIWKKLPSQQHGRLGCVGVLAPYRQRGLGRALIAQAMTAHAATGETMVGAEVDTVNIASRTLLSGFGGKVIGATIELYRAFSS
jgi:ribosomal protein S18 acetylase RimI-like enzyme